jgi:hypothetical protein
MDEDENRPDDLTVTTVWRQVETALVQAPQVNLSWLQTAATGGWALDLGVLRFLAALVRRMAPRHVMEFGSGVSSVLFKRVMAEVRGRSALSSIDHDPVYGRVAADRCHAEPVDRVRIRFQIAPLVVRDFGAGDVPCYHLRTDRLASRKPADLVLIDGPPDVLGGREGVLYQAMERVRTGTLVLLDDAGRPGERRCLALWRDNLGDAIETRELPGFPKGLAAVLVRRPVPASDFWEHRGRLSAQEIEGAVSPSAPLLLLDDNRWGRGLLPRHTVRFAVEQEGEYGGPPENGAAAVAALRNLSAAGVTHVAILWPAFWYLDVYPELREALAARGRRLVENARLQLFALHGPRMPPP